MAQKIYEQCYELTWDELDSAFRRFDITGFHIDLKRHVMEHMSATLEIRGTRYYLYFDSFEDAVWFRLKFL